MELVALLFAAPCVWWFHVVARRQSPHTHRVFSLDNEDEA